MNILITGASSGFGKLAVPLLLERGHTLVAALRGGEDRLRSTFPDELRASAGRLFALDLHLERPETFEAAARRASGLLGGRLDVLINNAGYGLFGAVEDQSPEQIRHQMEVNFFGPVLLTQKLLPMLRASRGRIINLSSVAGRFGFPFYGSYNASKFALEAITEGLYYDLRPHGVQVALIEPGGFRTDFASRSKVYAERAFAPDSPYRSRNLAMKRFFDKDVSAKLGDPMRVARLIVRLCEKRRIPLRNWIGLDAGFMMLLGRLFPINWVTRMVDYGFRKVAFRE